MAFTGVDDLVSEISNEKIFRADWQYHNQFAPTTVSISVGLDLGSSPGQYGAPNAFPGTALNWVTCNESAGNGTQIFGIPHGGNVSPDKKHLISAITVHPAGPPVVGGNLVLVDLQGYWPGISHTTTTTQTLVGTPSLRYANGDGCRLYMVTTTGLGATAHNIRINYYDQGNNLANTGLVAARVSSVVGQINSCLPGAAPSLYFPLVDGDTGVQNAANVTMSAASTAGVSALCLARPLIHIPLVTAAHVANEKEFVYQTPSMPEIKDGACLTWLYFSGTGGTSSTVAAGTNFYGEIQVAWG
jgi:hypothetical protein